MSGLLFVARILAVSALPLAACWLWFASRIPAFVPVRLLKSAFLGAAMVVPVAALQYLLPRASSGFGSVLFRSFVVAALVEEGVKLASLRMARRFIASGSGEAAAVGIAASLGLAIFETALYSFADPSVAIVRAVTAAPLHASCGARIGLAADAPSLLSPRAVFSAILAIAVHGAYDLSLFVPGFPSFFPIAIAVVAFISAIGLVGPKNDGDI
ncbi:MAG: hypothetical protein A2Z99_20090 [Treponema sp. GWB1_62_6]|nr:MAG: hypothetical protein A2Y36_00310 [Treponema sp. GWA1_62_8]OHE66916.1 MAG: hypothetical protein A2Z99_20090 [Treponema sp. GWB1_62_6]OHE69137.1 MAG: hypothetical protein A2001_12930 [Treponema sp. GWC1_61_84]OHE75405.1 MAG: hypothetical protein A2413_15485 [Treponema sp. RIFOXYC1_FULL_61_9]HCM27061.1 hypothetical protein [Treponema sp.]